MTKNSLANVCKTILHVIEIKFSSFVSLTPAFEGFKSLFTMQADCRLLKSIYKYSCVKTKSRDRVGQLQ